MHLKRLVGVMALLVLASCDAPPRESSGPIIDTLPNGLRVVTNVPPWLDGSAQGLIQASEELRIGTALSGGHHTREGGSPCTCFDPRGAAAAGKEPPPQGHGTLRGRASEEAGAER